MNPNAHNHEPLTFKPTLSTKTERLAEAHRQKLFAEGKEVNLVEILLHPKGKNEWLDE